MTVRTDKFRLIETYKYKGLVHFTNGRRLERKFGFLEKLVELMFTKVNYRMRKDAFEIESGNAGDAGLCL